MKDLIIITGGAGFIGSNLIKLFMNNTNFKIFSLDNYSAGKKENHIKEKRIKYFNSNTKNISKILKPYKKRINAIFHFGEFSRIHQSFSSMNECIKSNTIGSHEVFNFCLINKIKLIYSATSASLGNKGKDKDLSPYAFTKTKNIEMLENLRKWFKFKFEIIYFYNVYGPGQICTGSMATVIGIFEEQYRKKLPLTVVRPGSQSRRFTHINDTVDACYSAWKLNKCRHYIVSNKKSYTILEVAKMFNSKIRYLKPRKGERNSSALINSNLSNTVHKAFGKIDLKNYIKKITKG